MIFSTFPKAGQVHAGVLETRAAPQPGPALSVHLQFDVQPSSSEKAIETGGRPVFSHHHSEAHQLDWVGK